VAPSRRSASPSRKDSVDGHLPPEIRDAFASPIPAHDLALTIFAAPFVGVAPKSSVTIVIELDPGKLSFVEKGGTFNDDIEIHTLAIDANGKIQDGGLDVAPLRLRPANHDLVAQNGVRFSRRLQLPPGRYQIHVAARETSTGALGTVRQDLDVPDFGKGPIQMSGIALFSDFATRMPTANPDPALKDVLPGPATAVRAFPRSDTLALFAEVYDNQAGSAHRVAIKTSVLADDGSVVFTAGDERNSSELQGKKGGFGYTATIPLSRFAPGRYVLRVEAQAQVSNGGSAMRELELRVR
jgi:hypothetical protein